MILDIICLAVILIALLIGIFKGLFKMAARLVSIILALITACCFTGTVTSFLYDNLLAPKVGEMVDSKIEEMGAQEAVESIYTTVTEIQVGIAQLKGGEIPDNLKESVTRAQNFGTQASESLYAVGIDVNAIGNKIGETGAKTIDAVKNSDAFKGIQAKYDEISGWVSGFGSSFISNAAGDINLEDMDSILDKVESLNPIQKADPNVNSQVAKALTDVIKGPVIVFITPICFVLINILGILIYGLILNIAAGALEKIKIVDKAQKLGGAIIGVLVGAGIAFALVMIAQIFITPTSELYYVLDGSVSLDIAEKLKVGLGEVKFDSSMLDTIGKSASVK